MPTTNASTIESAIPPHLRCLRQRTRRIDEDFQPAFPATVARYRPEIDQVVMAYFGLQHREQPDRARPAVADVALRCIATAFAADDGPAHWDRAQDTDAAGFVNIVSIAYWDDADRYRRWFAEYGSAWARDGFGDTAIGTFTEVLMPSTDRFETLLSSGSREGIAVLGEGLSGPIREHAYWGGMRDRLPVSQIDALAPGPMPEIVGRGRHRRVAPQGNLCLIRSGQDWTATDGEERRMYLQDVEPVLRAGMDYLRHDGPAIGCIANRYMTVIDALTGSPTDKSFGMSWWRSLGALERWAESHPTHGAIFGAAMRYLAALGPAARLKLYHEVTVTRAEDQFFEYLDCHPDTGMLRTAFPTAPG